MKIGLDFGTTNSSIARRAENGSVELARFNLAGVLTESFRSLLYLERLRTAAATRLSHGPGQKELRTISRPTTRAASSNR